MIIRVHSIPTFTYEASDLPKKDSALTDTIHTMITYEGVKETGKLYDDGLRGRSFGLLRAYKIKYSAIEHQPSDLFWRLKQI